MRKIWKLLLSLTPMHQNISRKWLEDLLMSANNLPISWSYYPYLIDVKQLYHYYQMPIENLH